MSDPQSQDATHSLRWGVYGMLMAICLGSVLGRTLAVNSIDRRGQESERIKNLVDARVAELTAQGETPDLDALTAAAREEVHLQRPFLSSNDRSRWCAVRALVEFGKFEIDDLMALPDWGNWNNVDLVKHVGPDGEMHYYSSKPPLFSLLLAGEYWVLHKLTGWTLGDHAFELGRLMVLSVNLPLLLLYLWCMAKLIDRIGRTDAGRIFAVAVASLATFLPTFSVSINNHLLAACGVAVALTGLLSVVSDGNRASKVFLLTGFAAACAFVFELPALCFLLPVTIMLFRASSNLTLRWFLPLACVVIAVNYGCNYWVHGSFREPYSHRSLTDPGDNWYRYTTTVNGQEVPSHWTNPKGIDRGEPSKVKYFLHATVGHHGLFSLTPLWILSIPGCVVLARRADGRHLAWLAAQVSVVTVGFYCFMLLARDRNYGGMTSGLRWTFWLIPLWLLAMTPTVDWLHQRSWGRWLCWILLAASALSCNYPTWNPWTHPWITNWFLDMGWIRFD
jgi:hypothetical protein